MAVTRLPAAVEQARYEHSTVYSAAERKGSVLRPNISMAPDCASPRPFAPKARRKEDSLVGALCAFVVDHQIGLSVNLLLLLTFAHVCFPRARRRTQKFFALSYYDEASGKYTQGWDDICFVFFWIVVFTGLRAAVMDYVLNPLARMGGISKKKANVRFCEQGWVLIYYTSSWTLGMYVIYNSKYWLNLHELWTDWPTPSMTGTMKWYYLVQFAVWLQQILVIHIEERRKDHWQMFTHHILTCTLLFTSYGAYQTRAGNLVLVLMDVVDIILPAAKLLKYLGCQTACDIAFGVFMVTWFITRHILYLMVCWSVHKDLPVGIPYGCYSSATGERLSNDGGNTHGGNLIGANVLQAFQNPGGTVCWNYSLKTWFLGLLLALQVVAIVWFGMVVRVAYKVLSGQPADDVRSDDEGDEEEEEVPVDVEKSPRAKSKQPKRPSPPPSARARTPPKPIEEEVGAESLHYTPKSSRPQRRSSGRSSGLQIPGHSDRKDILDRIGCERKTNE